jgi:hypothetical protein
MDALTNDIFIYRRTDSGDRKRVNVLPLYGDRTRMFKSIENPNKTVVLPAIVVSMESFSRDPARVSGLHDWISEIPDMVHLSDEEYEQYYNFFTPVPVNIEYKVDVITRYMEDLDQIHTNFIPFSNPSFYVVQRHPKLKNSFLKSQVVWSGAVSLTNPNAIASTDSERYFSSTTFTFKTWIFAGEGFQPSLEEKLINKINFYPEVINRNGTYTLSNFFPVDNKVSFSDFKDQVLLGKIRAPEHMDYFTLSGNFNPAIGSGTVSGFWSGISAMLSGEEEFAAIPLSSDPAFLFTEAGNLLVFGDASIANDSMEKWNITGFLKELEDQNINYL